MILRILIVGIFVAAVALSVAHCSSQMTFDHAHVALHETKQRADRPEDVLGVGTDESGDDDRPSMVSSVKRHTAGEGSAIDDSLLAMVREVLDAGSASAMVRALNDLAVQEPEFAARKRIELADFCNPVIIEAQGGPLKAGREKFCNGFDWEKFGRSRYPDSVPTDDIGANALVESLDPYLRMGEEIAAAIRLATEEGRSDAYTRLARDSRFLEEIFELISHNARYAREHGGRPQWRLGQELRQSLYPKADLLRAQEIALTLYACRRFGGCGVNQYFSMVYCTAFLGGRCKAGSGVEEMLYQTTPPADFNLALDILQRL